MISISGGGKDAKIAFVFAFVGANIDRLSPRDQNRRGVKTTVEHTARETDNDALRQQLTVDVNIFDLPHADVDAQRAWLGLRERGALLWTPWHGGHWIATSGALIEKIYRTPDIFSNREVGIPPKKFPVQLLPIQLDGMEHKAFRALIDPAFRPAAVQRYGVTARQLARDLIDDLYPNGRCEFVADFSMIMPLAIFLSIVDLPVEDRVTLHTLARGSSRSPTQEQRAENSQKMVGYLEYWIDKRRAQPGDDLLSSIVHAKVDGKPLNQEQVVGTAMLLLFAGLDTVASMMAFVMQHLAGHPEHRQWMIDNPSKISFAVEELMRRHGVANNVRTATRNVELDGIMIRKDEIIVIPNCLHGLDDRQFDHAQEIDFDRAMGQTAMFGWGPHRCVGANLARLEMRILMEEWLARIPDFEIDHDDMVIQQSGTVNGVLQLPLRWNVA